MIKHRKIFRENNNNEKQRQLKRVVIPIKNRCRFGPQEEDHNQKQHHICYERQQVIAGSFEEKPQATCRDQTNRRSTPPSPQQEISNCKINSHHKNYNKKKSRKNSNKNIVESNAVEHDSMVRGKVGENLANDSTIRKKDRFAQDCKGGKYIKRTREDLNHRQELDERRYEKDDQIRPWRLLGFPANGIEYIEKTKERI